MKHTTAVSLTVLLMATACSNITDVPTVPIDDVHDRTLGQSRSEIESNLNRPDLTFKPRQPPRVKKRSFRKVKTKPSDLGPRVSIATTDVVPLKEILINLATEADQEIEVDPRIEGGIVLSIKDRPYFSVIERIAKLANLRYRYNDGILRVELDEPYYDTYSLNLLNVQRSTESTVNTSVDVVTGSGSGNGSESAVESISTNDLWEEIAQTIDNILLTQSPTRLLSSGGIEAASVEPAAPPVAGALENSSQTGSLVPDLEVLNLPGIASSLDEVAAQNEALAQLGLVDQAQTALVEDGGEIEAVTGTLADVSTGYSINRAAGLINVFGSEKQHDAVAKYLDEISASLQAQVLIEAKLFEVDLNEGFATGINWRAVFNNLSIANRFSQGQAAIPGPFNTLTTAASNAFSVAIDTDDLEGVISLIETFGTVRTLSSPRVTVLQNNTAVLKVAENRVYFQLDFERTEDENGDETITVGSEISTVPVGVVITVQPSIDVGTENIVMSIRPTVTRVAGEVADPAVSIASNDTTTSLVPIVAVQEIDSVVKLRSGDTIVMGGLMQDSVTNESSGVPFFSRLPWLGHLFKSRLSTNQQSELVIFLRASIVPDQTFAEPKDIQIYEDLSGDRRWLDLPGTGQYERLIEQRAAVKLPQARPPVSKRTTGATRSLHSDVKELRPLEHFDLTPAPKPGELPSHSLPELTGE